MHHRQRPGHRSGHIVPEIPHRRLYHPHGETGSTDYAPLAAALVRVGCIYGAGVLCSWSYSRIMVNVSQGTMRDLRDQVFRHMERLPISYFDRHAHGDIMSVYTNDIDTLRQMISQSLPQLVNSSVTIVTVFVSMVILNIPLTVLTCAMIVLILNVSKRLAAKSSKYFVEQQRNLGAVNGYIEEMMDGQKVVKVFCHEQESLDGFLDLNEKLRVSANNANKFANIMMPTVAQMGNCSYALCAVLGSAMAVGGFGGITLGTLVSFLTLNKNFTQPFSQLSQQANSVVMALAGAQRVFALLDEKPETDDGYVTLVNAAYDHDNNLVETDRRTGTWAWKHPHKAEAPSPTRRSGATLSSTVWTSATRRRRSSSTTSSSMAVPARRSPSSAPPVPARPPSPTSSTGSTTFRTARSGMTASISTRSKRRICGGPWASSSRTPICLPAQ